MLLNTKQLSSVLEKIDWEYLVDRRESVLHRSFTAVCYDHFFKETGIRIKRGTIVRPGGEVWYPREVLEKIRQTFRAGGVRRFLDFQKRLVRTVGALERITTSYERQRSLTTLSDATLRKRLIAFVELTVAANAFLLPFPVADKILVDLIRAALPPASLDEQTEWIRTLTYPRQENTHVQELKALYRFAQHRKPNVARHVRRFGWIGARGLWWGDAWTARMIQKRLANMRAAHEDPTAALEHLAAMRRTMIRNAAALTKKLGITAGSSLAQRIAIARDYAYLRTWRTDVIYGSSYRARVLFQELAKRSHVPYLHLPYLTYHELLTLIHTFAMPITAVELKRRIAAGKNYLVTIRHGHDYFVYTGPRWVKYFQRIVHGKQERTRGGLVRGQTAYPGVVHGRVCIVRTPEDLPKVKRGDILVAVMTFPNFIPAMEKAAAFVTDEGGILCHAAIVAREMKKPCVIGTKIATKVFRDGERVIVNSNTGVVRKVML